MDRKPVICPDYKKFNYEEEKKIGERKTENVNLFFFF